MDERTLFTAADAALKSVIDQINADQWEDQPPVWFSLGRGGADVTLRTIINYHAYDEAWVPDTLAGRTIQEVGDKHDGDLLGANPASAYAKLLTVATTAVNNLKDLKEPVHLSYGAYPAREYLWHTTIFRGFRSYQLAIWLGQDGTMSPDLVEGLTHVAEPHLSEWRKLGVFGPALPVPPDADAQTKLLAETGYLVPDV